MANNLKQLVTKYRKLGIDNQLDYDKFYLYSLITHSTAIEGSTITELENQIMFDHGVSLKGKSIEAIPAPQGTAVEADQSGDALPVGLHSQPGTGDDWRFHDIRGNHSPGQANP